MGTEKISDQTLVEIRTDRTHYTVIPPSCVPVNGNGTLEQLQWLPKGEPLQCDFVLLRSTVLHVAITALLVRHFVPDGERWKFYEALAGFLLSLDLSEIIVAKILEEASRQVKDTDTSPRPGEWVRRTAARLEKDRKCSAAPTVAKMIGEHGPAVVARIREWCRGADADAADRIVIAGGKLTDIVEQAQAALLKTTPIYQRGGVLTRAIKLDTATGDARDVRREAGSTMLIGVKEPWLIEQMARVQQWVRHTAETARKEEHYTPVDPPAIYARTLLGRAEWPFPVLRGVVTAPTLARDGRIIERPGYDPASGLLVDCAAGSFPAVVSHPTREDAEDALALLQHPLRSFPFVDAAAKSVALSALLTALVRVNLRTAPLHGFDAPTAGTGKSLLAEMAGLLAMGFRPPALSQGKTAEEDEKRLATVLFAGDPVIHIDNCEQPIAGDFLCSMLTQEVVQARILGLSERRVLPSTALVIASGNNLTFAGDTSRRAVVCRLDAKVERPDTRTFDFDCHAEVLAARPELVIAGLTILRAYHIAGRPQKLTPMGSFSDWEWIRGALVWLHCADPADTRSTILDNDTEREELIDVMDLWLRARGTTATSVAGINAAAEASPKEHEPLPLADITLRNKLIEVACKGKWSAKSVGWWLRGHKDRVIAGRCFRSGQHKGRSGQEWHLEVEEGAGLKMARQELLLDQGGTEL